MNSEIQVDRWPIERVIPYPRNARTIPDAAVDKVAASIKEFGWRQPIVVDKNAVIVIGHVRRLAALKLGLAEAPVHVADNLSDAQIKALRLMDNRSHDETDFDLALLGPELVDLRDLAYDLSQTGFDAREIDALLVSPDADEKANVTPPLPEVAVTQPEDLWCCGPHRILCSDGTQESATSRLLARTVPILLVSDPPYGVELEPEWREEVGLNPRTVQGAKLLMMTASTGRQPGGYSLGTSLMSGTPGSMPEKLPLRCLAAISRSEHK